MSHITAQFGQKISAAHEKPRDPSIINAFGQPKWAATREAKIGALMKRWAVPPQSEESRYRISSQFVDEIFAILSENPITTTEICAQTGRSNANVCAALRDLERNGRAGQAGPSGIGRGILWVRS